MKNSLLAVLIAPLLALAACGQSKTIDAGPASGSPAGFPPVGAPASSDPGTGSPGTSDAAPPPWLIGAPDGPDKKTEVGTTTPPGTMPWDGTSKGGLALPGPGELYHGIFTIPTGGENPSQAVDSYEQAVGGKVAWVYFGVRGDLSFPSQTMEWIRARGAVPFVRLELRTVGENTPEPVYSPAAIAAGKFDAQLTAWGKQAKAFGTPIVAEYGVEVNGNWFPWNGQWNGGANGGTAAFRNAFRHIAQTIRAAGADNVLFAFHVNTVDWPSDSWNAMENYYPGDDVVDWIGLSHYGSIDPSSSRWWDFVQYMDPAMARLTKMAPTKPIFVFEFGTVARSVAGNAGDWADKALGAMVTGRWPNLKGFAWWNESWASSDLRVQDDAGLKSAFQKWVADPRVLKRPKKG